MREISESISLDRLLHSDETSRVLDQAQNARRPAQFRLITGAIISTTPAALLRYLQQPKVIACYVILATLFHLGPQGDGQTLFLGGMAAIFYYPALCAICLGVARIAPAHPVPLTLIIATSLGMGAALGALIMPTDSPLWWRISVAMVCGVLGEYIMIWATLPALDEPPQQQSKVLTAPQTTGPSQTAELDIQIGAITLAAQQLLMIGAEEHYVRIVTETDTFLTRHKFTDAVITLAPLQGMQVHRSFWIADHAVRGMTRAENGLIVLNLVNGQDIPVSRRRTREVKRRFAHLLR